MAELTPQEREEKRRQEDAENTFNHFWCLLCEGQEAPQFEDAKAFCDHVREHHPEAVRPDGKIGGRKQMLSHLDADGWYQDNFRWLLPDGKAVAQQCQRYPRRRGYGGR